jgi:toxin ParE1/3/4
VKVVITDAAMDDLVGIAEYIRPHNPDRALTFVNELLEHCQTLAEMPDRHPLVPRYERHGIRRCVHANYLIFYRAGGWGGGDRAHPARRPGLRSVAVHRSLTKGKFQGAPIKSF